MTLLLPKRNDVNNFTLKGVATRGTERNAGECPTASKRMKKLSNFEVPDFIEKNGMKCETEL